MQKLEDLEKKINSELTKIIQAVGFGIGDTDRFPSGQKSQIYFTESLG